MGCVLERALPSCAACVPSGVFLDGLYQPDDAVFHAGRTGAGIYHRRPRQSVAEWRIIWVHALRNAAVPLITVIALSYAGLLEGSVLTETVFAWPGLGQYLTNSLQNADMNAVLGGTLVIGVIFVGLNLLSDLLYTVLDPRVRRRK